MPMETAEADRPLFTLRSPYSDPVRNLLFSALKKPLSRLLRLEDLNAMYAGLKEQGRGDEAFLDQCMELLGISANLPEDALSRIPAKGPLMVVANHPFGVVEGLVILKLLRQARPDTMVMANHLLGLVPELRQYLVGVDPFGTVSSARNNVAGIKHSLKYLKGGGAMIVFPAGEVASLKLSRRMVADPDWSPTVAGIARRSGASVLPVFFQGRNSSLFQTLGLVHPRLRTVLIPRENLRRMGTTVDISVGSPIPAAKLQSFEDDRRAVEYMRFRTYLLRKDRRRAANEDRTPGRQGAAADARPLARPEDAAVCEGEVLAIPRDRLLLRSGDFRVVEARGGEIPHLMREIGRLREKTFREVGEGTGNAVDIDAYDEYYSHLLLWNDAKRELVGAYRFVRTDEVLPARGPSGLYSCSLFRMRPQLLQAMQPSLELGRSFIRSEYQRSYQPLLLLWKGLAEVVARNPKYNRLFGCVSVSGDYQPASRELIVRFMQRHFRHEEFSPMVQARRPPRLTHVRRMDLSVSEDLFGDPQDVSTLVAEIERDKSIPVLLKQYLKLGGKLLGFNMDPDFGDCMDGLIMVDLLDTDPRVLARFMGADRVEDFLACHDNRDMPARAAFARSGEMPMGRRDRASGANRTSPTDDTGGMDDTDGSGGSRAA